MNNRQNGRRRGRGGERVPNAPNRGPNPNQRPDNRARGNAAQLHEKYKALARDLQMQGDRVTAEYYLQFADHYFRVLSENRARFEEQRPRRDWQQSDGDEASDGGEESYEAEEGERETQLDQQQRRDEPRYGGPPNGEARYDDRDNGRRVHEERSNGPIDNGAERFARRPEQHDREEVSERIEVDRLPPSIPFDASPRNDGPAENDEPMMEEAPRRRGRPRRPRPDDLPSADA
jgi:hypothetical protein